MAASYSDKYTLTTDPTFQHRVQQAMTQACQNIQTEGWLTPFHRERSRYCAQILNSPGTYLPLFVNVVANDSAVISDATAAGAVVLTAANVAAQAALVTDAHMDNAVSANFNSFFPTPAIGS